MSLAGDSPRPPQAPVTCDTCHEHRVRCLHFSAARVPWSCPFMPPRLHRRVLLSLKTTLLALPLRFLARECDQSIGEYPFARLRPVVLGGDAVSVLRVAPRRCVPERDDTSDQRRLRSMSAA